VNHRIEVRHKPVLRDGREDRLLTIIEEDTGLKPESVHLVNAYTLFGEYSEKELGRLRDELFCDPVSQDGATGHEIGRSIKCDYAIEVAYKQGVTDNVGRTAARGVSDIVERTVPSSSVLSSMLYLFTGSQSPAEQERIARKVLCNELIEQYTILSSDDIQAGKSASYEYVKNQPVSPPYYKEVDLEVDDATLQKISEDGLLFLTVEEMKTIRDHYRDQKVRAHRTELGLPAGPTDVELEVFAQTWSEHCKHKIFAATIDYDDGSSKSTIESLFKTYIKGSTDVIGTKRDDLLSLFKDNAGVVRFNDEHAYCVKVETHNSPSALDPYGGAMTGIVGVNRDIIGTGMGAYPIFNTDIFCFGSPYTSENDIPDNLLHPRRIFRGVHRGVKDGGNESGIPTVNGSITFDPTYLGKPLVFCGTGGIMPVEQHGRPAYEKYVEAGHLIVMSGGRIGKDGIHGATFSSAHLSQSSPTSAVQIGDPITQKKMVDFLMEARDLGLYSGLTDNGAGGLSSSIGEMAEFTNGARLDLDKCPLKYSGLQPWEILLSEAQERMSIAVPAEHIDEFLELSRRRDVESTVIGEFTDSGFFECFYNGEVVLSLDMKMLHEGLPAMHLKAAWKPPAQERIEVSDSDLAASLQEIVARPNVASKESWVRMYDHEVGGRTVGKPFSGKRNDGPSDGGVLKVFPDSNEGLVVTHGLVPRYSRFDSYQMAGCAIDEAVRSAVALGADPKALVGLDNFCWPDPVESDYTPDGQYKLAQLVRACQAVYDLSIAYNCPCISGKDSMKNDYKSGDTKISVLPTLLFTVTGKIEDISRMTSFYFKNPGDRVFVLGETRAELGASEYADMKGLSGGMVPAVDSEAAATLYDRVHGAINDALLASIHDVSDGGLIVALAEAAWSGNCGVKADISAIGEGLTTIEKLFSETPSRFVVSVAADKVDRFKEMFTSSVCVDLGTVTDGNSLQVTDNGSVVIETDLVRLKESWQQALVF
jgi:phosphoribosylformylglycinamidine synthase II